MSKSLVNAIGIATKKSSGKYVTKAFIFLGHVSNRRNRLLYMKPNFHISLYVFLLYINIISNK